MRDYASQPHSRKSRAELQRPATASSLFTTGIVFVLLSCMFIIAGALSMAGVFNSSSNRDELSDRFVSATFRQENL